MAGVGVMFYVLLAAAGRAARSVALRRQPASRGWSRCLPWWPWAPWPTWWWPGRQQPPPGGAKGLGAASGRADAAGHCWRCSTPRARRRPPPSTLALHWAPRINAAGRLADMTLGIECLLTDDAARADELAQPLDAINRERREIEGGMREQAMQLAEGLFDEGEPPPPSASSTRIFTRRGGHRRLAPQDRLHRPTFVFAASSAPGKEHELKGSGPLHRRLSPARRAGSGGQAPSGRDAEVRRPRHGAAGCTMAEEAFGDLRAGLRPGGPGMAGRRHPHAPAGDRRPWRPNTAAPSWWTTAAAGLGPGLCPRPPSASRCRC